MDKDAGLLFPPFRQIRFGANFSLAEAGFEATRFELRGLSGSTVLFTFDDVLVVEFSVSIGNAA